MTDGLRLLENVSGLPLTILHDTCSGSPPYDRIEAGCTLKVSGVIWDEPGSPPEAVQVWLDVGGDSDEVVSLTLAEVYECTNLLDLVEVPELYAAARRVAPSPAA